MPPVLECKNRSLDLSKPHVMGVLNVTPDSFSDGGKFSTVETALEQARKIAREGASIVDVGGESTRPGAIPVSIQQELDRTLPIVEAIKKNIDIIISIDTNKPEVMRAAVEAGANVVNDVNALRAPGAIEVIRDLDVPVCLMHMQGAPRSMQDEPYYENVVMEVKNFLQHRIAQCVEKGILRNKIIIDPGFGFGKSVTHNLSLVKHLAEFKELGLPILMGVSRKSTIGAILNAEVEHRLYGGLSLATLCCWLGASIIRSHDVRATVDVLKICHAVKINK